MAPAPKKKNFNKRGGDISQDSRNNVKPAQQPNLDETKNSKVNIPIIENESGVSGGKKYDKRSIVSNWSKYDEPEVDPHSDSLKGEDFEVLMSYCGGSSSQLQLQDEKEWEEESSIEQKIVLDFHDVAQALKCIPFHHRLNLPENIFDKIQLNRFVSCAEDAKSNYLSRSGVDVTNEREKKNERADVLDSSLNIIESCESQETFNMNSNKPPVLDIKTESIIESLASCLSLKSSVKEKSESNPIKNETVTDDLDFLLSLNVASNGVNISKNNETTNVKKETNVDDWLNSLLDD